MKSKPKKDIQKFYWKTSEGNSHLLGFFCPFFKSIWPNIWGQSKKKNNCTLCFIILWSIQHFHTQHFLPDDPKVLVNSGDRTHSKLGSRSLLLSPCSGIGAGQSCLWPSGHFHPPPRYLLAGQRSVRLLCTLPQNAAGAPHPTVRAIQEEDQGVELWLQGISPGLRFTHAPGLISPLTYKELWYLLVP